MHPLDAWLQKQGKTREWLADRLGTTESSLSRIIAGKQWPSRGLVSGIFKITKGAVTPTDFLAEAS